MLTPNELELIEVIRSHDKPVEALLIAIDIITQVLQRGGLMV